MTILFTDVPVTTLLWMHAYVAAIIGGALILLRILSTTMPETRNFPYSFDSFELTPPSVQAAPAPHTLSYPHARSPHPSDALPTAAPLDSPPSQRATSHPASEAANHASTSSVKGGSGSARQPDRITVGKAYVLNPSKVAYIISTKCRYVIVYVHVKT